MKSKKVTYLLITITVLVWGLIFYRIVISVNPENKVLPVQYTNKKSKEEILQKDTFFLLANYRDPFLGKPYREQSAVVRSKVRNNVPVKAEEPFDWSIITYNGLIKSKTHKKKIALLTVRGKEYIANEGDKIEDVTLLKNYGDSVKVSCAGKTHVFLMPQKY